MRINRKKNHRYRFNGHPYFHSFSSFTVKAFELEQHINECEARLADPYDPDDKKWTARWLNRYQMELDKKRKGYELKSEERRKHRLRGLSHQRLFCGGPGEGTCGCNS